MTARRSRIKIAFALVVLATLVVFFWSRIQEARSVGALESCRVHSDASVVLSRAAVLPAFVDSAANRFLRSLAARGVISNGPDPINRFNEILGGPVDAIQLQGPFLGDPGEYLTRFPHLRILLIYDGATAVRGVVSPTEAEWCHLCASVRDCPQLEAITFIGNEITDAAIASLAGHPGLTDVGICSDGLTPACVATLATLPKLTLVGLSNHVPMKGPGIHPADLPAMRKALPHVKIQFEQTNR